MVPIDFSCATPLSTVTFALYDAPFRSNSLHNVIEDDDRQTDGRTDGRNTVARSTKNVPQNVTYLTLFL